MKREFLELVKACGKDEELLDFVEASMNHMTTYVAKVAFMEYALPMYNVRYEGEELRDKVQDLDQKRRSAHEAAIASVNSLTRLAKSMGVEPMYHGDPDNRYQIADFCENMVHEFFVERSGIPNHMINEYVDIAAHENTVLVKDGNSVTEVTKEEFERALLDGNPYEPAQHFDSHHHIPSRDMER